MVGLARRINVQEMPFCSVMVGAEDVLNMKS